MSRKVLPARRRVVTFKVKHRYPSTGNEDRHHVSVGLYQDQAPGEIFINAGKVGSDVQALMRDAAIAISLALQYGCSMEEIRKSITRETDGSPSSVIGTVVDAVVTEIKS